MISIGVADGNLRLLRDPKHSTPPTVTHTLLRPPNPHLTEGSFPKHSYGGDCRDEACADTLTGGPGGLRRGGRSHRCCLGGECGGRERELVVCDHSGYHDWCWMHRIVTLLPHHHTLPRRYRDVRIGEGGRAAVVVHAEAKADAVESAKQKRVAAFTNAAKNRSVCARAAQAGGEGAARAARRRRGTGDGEEDGDKDNNEETATRRRGDEGADKLGARCLRPFAAEQDAVHSHKQAMVKGCEQQGHRNPDAQGGTGAKAEVTLNITLPPSLSKCARLDRSRPRLSCAVTVLSIPSTMEVKAF